MTINVAADPRVYISASQLARFQYQVNAMSLHPSRRASSLMSGRHLSHFRGRGLNFEEYRHYQVGDDIRDLDWRVTMRTRSPMIKVFSEEKDLPVILVVDQRLTMLFSTVNTMKSVVAAELAALCAWQIAKKGDRVGSLVLGEEQFRWLPPKRSQQHLGMMMQQLVKFNNQLNFDKQVDTEFDSSLERAFKMANQHQLKGALFIVISDFSGFNDEGKKQLRRLQQENDVIAVQVTDPMEQELQGSIAQYVSDGEQQVSLPTSQSELAMKYAAASQGQAKFVRSSFALRNLPFVEVTTDGEHIKQFQKALGFSVK